MNDKKQAKTRNTNNPDVLDTDKEVFLINTRT